MRNAFKNLQIQIQSIHMCRIFQILKEKCKEERERERKREGEREREREREREIERGRRER